MLYKSFESIESKEAGVSQAGLCDRIFAAAAGDGYFRHLSHDLYPGHGRAPPFYHERTTDVVPRIGHVKRVPLASLDVGGISGAMWNATGQSKCD